MNILMLDSFFCICKFNYSILIYSSYCNKIIVTGGNMLKTVDDLLADYKNYQNPYSKIIREEKKGNLIKLKRGLYEDDPNCDPFSVASYLYSPSYISFETALSYHGMIPEEVRIIKSATFHKNKKKEYINQFGRFIYEDVPIDVFPYGNEVVKNGNYTITIASKEKSITDLLYKISPVNSIRGIRILLFEDLRINESIFDNLDFYLLDKLCVLYKNSNHKMLRKMLRKDGFIND